MNKSLFQQFLKEAQVNERVSWDYEEAKLYAEILDNIYRDVAKFKNYTLDGRFQDILVELLKNPKYETEGYNSLLKDLENELNKLAVKNVILLPINFIDICELNGDVKLNEYMNIFLPTKEDLLDYDDFTLIMRQEKRKKDKKGKMNDNLCKYFEEELNCKLDKNHILLTKDKNFFNYPILSIKIQNIDCKVEKESGRIAEAVYSILRMIDFQNIFDNRWGLLDTNWRQPANTYVVYYNLKKYHSNVNENYYGYSFRLNFSYFLDINTNNFINNNMLFTEMLDLYINTCFLDVRKYDEAQLKKINKWNNAILMFNTAYEFASIEKYDACSLIICALLESLFLKNEGNHKKDRLKEKITEFLKDIYENNEVEKIADSLESVYDHRNDIIHEGNGYEAKYMSSRRINDYQGIYRGMRPFSYNGAFYPYKDILAIKDLLKSVADILTCSKMLQSIREIF